MDATKHRVLSLLMVLALAACSGGSNGTDGKDGKDGPAGPTGPAGPPGAPGRSTGGVMGTLTYKVAGVVYPATNVNVTSVPDWCGTATSDAEGNYELGSGCPIGVYEIVFSGNGFQTLRVPNVSIAAGKEFILNRELVALNPIVLKAATMPNPAGFGREVTLGVSVTGGTPPYKYEWTPRPTNPTAVTLSATNVAAPTFTTGALADVIASGKVIGLGASLGENGLPFRSEFLGVSTQQLAQMTYNFDVVVTDTIGFFTKLAVAVVPATLAQGNGSVPVGTLVIARVAPGAAPVSFDKSGAPGSSAVLNAADTEFPWFVADVRGTYLIGSSLAVTASSFVGSSLECGFCHEVMETYIPGLNASIADKFKRWNNSAHGNHFFKYMEYDQSGALVWKTVNGKPIPAPTANPTVFWDQPGAMTTFQFGMTGAEGTHYGANCVACHTTGYNAALQNGGFDDVAKAAGWTFPDLKTVFTGLTGDASSDLVTPAPQLGAWNAVPAAAKALAGMQCESCHGPLGRHASGGSLPPVGEYSVAACAVCHDRPSNHDRVALWRQSGHANVGLADREGTGSGSCARCHSAQGFVKYAQDTTQGTVASGATHETVQPQTCAACHDSHATTVRITGKNPVYVAAGFSVSGVGTGALCMACHNGRRGLRGDGIAMTSFRPPHAPTQTEVLMGMNAYFIGDANGFRVGGHAAVAETCVGCHMKTAVDGLRFTNTNHTFGFGGQASSICKECHGEEVNGEAIETAFVAAHARVSQQLLATLWAAVDGSGFTVAPAGEGHGADSGDPIFLPGANIASIAIEEDTFVFQLVAPVDVTFPAPVGTITTSTVRCAAADLQDPTGTISLLAVDGVVSRSLWNLGLVNDGSKGLHNPSFVFEVLQATEAALRAETPPGPCAATCL